MLTQVYSDLTKGKQVPRLLAMGKPSIETTVIHHFFGVDGTIRISNDCGDEFTISPAQLGFKATIKLYKDDTEEVIAYRLSFAYRGKNYEVWIYFKFASDPYKVKIAIKGSIPTQSQVKLTFSSAQKMVLQGKCLWHGSANPEYSDTLQTAVGFDWSDVRTQVSFDDVNKQIIFNVGTDFNIDPSVVSSNTSQYAITHPFQRKIWWVGVTSTQTINRYYVFYSNGTNMVYKHSADGINWSAEITVRAATYGYDFSVWFDGTYFHYAYYPTGTSAQDLKYRRSGMFAADYSIIWGGLAEVTALAGATDKRYRHPFVSVDTQGYAFIGYQLYDATVRPTAITPYVIKSGTKDGTWGTTPAPFPYQLNSTTRLGYMVSVLPLTNQDMLTVYGSDGGLLRARFYDYSANTFDSEVTSTTNVYYGYAYSAVSIGDTVHVAFLSSTNLAVTHISWSYNSFSSETTVETNTTSTSAPVLALDMDTTCRYIFWMGSPTANHIYYKLWDGSWGSRVDWLDESSDILASNTYITSFYEAGNNYVAIAYITKTSGVAPYQLKFALLSTVPYVPPKIKAGLNVPQALAIILVDES